MPKITKIVVEALKPSKVGIEGSKHHFVWDSELRGFGVCVSSTGTKSFVVQYRNPAGKSRRKVIGRYGLLTAEEARRTAKAILGDVAKGVYVEEDEKQRLGRTVDEICDWYLERADAGKIIGRARRPIKASTLAMDTIGTSAHRPRQVAEREEPLIVGPGKPL